MKLSLLTLASVAVCTATTFADDPQFRNRQIVDRMLAAQKSVPAPTIAIYTGDRGVGRSVQSNDRSDLRVTMRDDGHGHRIVLFKAED